MSVCLYSSVTSTQCACVMLWHLACLVLQRNDFRKKVLEHKMCVLVFFRNLSATFLILRSIERDIIKMFVCLHVKYPLFLSYFNEI